MVVLSPHLDDAVLSLGQHIIEWKKEGKRIKVITVFTKFGDGKDLPDYSKNYLFESGFESTKKFEEARVKEDETAMKKLGVDFEHWGLVDAGFRNIYNSKKELMGGVVDPRDKKLEKQIKEKLMKVSAADLFLVPAGVGGHVDHVMINNIGKEIINKKYYLDVPYIWQNLNFVKYLGKILRAKMGKTGGAEKMEILKCYQSQYGLLVRGNQSFREIVI